MSKYPLWALLVLVNKLSERRRFHAGMVRLLVRNLQPIDTTELAKYKKIQILEYQRNYLLITLTNALSIDTSQLLQYWNEVTREHNNG